MAPTIGQGATFSWRGITVGKIVAYSGPTKKNDRKECTNTDSLGWREYCTGLKDGGTVHVECLLDSASKAGAWAIINDAGTTGTFVITYASGFSWTGSALVDSVTPSGGPDELEKIAFDLTITGTPTPSS